MGTLATRLVLLPPRDPESKGVVERRNGWFETSFMPGRTFASPADFTERPILDLLRHVAAPDPRAIAIVGIEERLTYAELLDRVQRIARYIAVTVPVGTGAVEVGAVTESVVVSGQLPYINTDNPEVGTNLNRADLLDVPLSISGGRYPEALAYSIMPGAAGGT